jgi:hypothetical protein
MLSTPTGPHPRFVTPVASTRRARPIRPARGRPTSDWTATVVGRVVLWGRVLAHSGGWRAELAYPAAFRSRDWPAQTLARILTRSCVGEEPPTHGRLVGTSVESGGSHEPATLNAPRARRPAQSRPASRGTDRRALRAAQRGRCCSPGRAADKLRTRSRGVVDLQAPARPPSGLPHHGLGTFRRRREGCPPPVPALLRTGGTTSEGAQRGVRATAVHVERVELSGPVADHDLPVGEDR